ncbi:hypothetical protein DCO48_15855 [Pseudomonas sp. SDI]|uniref:hypothetical protein n=1 Tax=Pseudomonas sp. SDI TaxID=2170734 RepID=UPI000DE6CBF3|nr:hypothetical protein [Pseudomonas sp. SDI]PWB31697.1 hypothetical protein DCO48_15855 [Pseudomonas sp. SDI]
MSKKSLTELVGELQGRSVTHGWDAITLYDQRKANELLYQHYIERFLTHEGVIKPASFTARWGDGSYKEHIYDLRFGAPRLSFESADPAANAQARLTLDMIGGTIVSTRKHGGLPAAVARILHILPVGGPQVWMTQPLTKAQLKGTGEVLIDLGNADTFMANFVLGELAQAEVGRRFKAYFDSLEPARKVYSLGRVTGDLNGPLTPSHFEIRTMKANPEAAVGDLQYGEGAVMLFITLAGGKDGQSYPSHASQYLLPADGNGVRFTGALYLSSRVLFGSIVRAQAVADIGHGIEFPDYTGGQDKAWRLHASAGGIEHAFVYDYKTRAFDFDCRFSTDLNARFGPDSNGPALTLEGLGKQMVCRWSKNYLSPFSRVVNWAWPSVSEWHHGEIRFVCDYQVLLDIGLDQHTGVVTFQRNEQRSRLLTRMSCDAGWLPDLGDVERAMRAKVQGFFEPQLRGVLRNLSVPALDTFLLRNLLFPGHNALQLTEAFVPGDLALFGEIDPLRTSTVLSPTNKVVAAGTQLQFSITPRPEQLSWSVRDTRSHALLDAAISPDGLFRAPSADRLRDGQASFVVTARGVLQGLPVQSSALVSVIENVIVANPVLECCTPGESRELLAQALDGGPLKWQVISREWGSRLEGVPGEPDKRLYTAGGSSDPDVPFALDRIEVSQACGDQVVQSTLHVLIYNRPAGATLYLSDNSTPEKGTVQFELRGKAGPIDPKNAVWKLLGGPGVFDVNSGRYTEPAVIPPGSFIVVSAKLPGDLLDTHAVIAVPLPLRRYAQLIGDVDAAHVRACEDLPRAAS